MYKIVLVDDDDLVRIGLESLISFREKGFQIVDSLSNSILALDSIKRNQPDVIITDLYMPGIDGLQLVRRAKELCPKAFVVILSCHNDINSIKEALQLGVFDYQLKSSIVDPKNANALLDRLARACSSRSAKKAPSPADQSPSVGKRSVLYYLQCGLGAAAPARQAFIRRKVDISSGSLFLAGLQLDNYQAISKAVSSEEAMLSNMEKLLDSLLEIYGNGFSIYVQNGIFLLLLQINSVTAAISPYSRLASICDRIRLSVKDQFLYTCCVYINKSYSFDRLPHAYQVLMQEIENTSSINYDSIVDLVSYAASIYTEASEEAANLPSHPVEKLVKYIEVNYAQTLSLDELAQEVGYSKYHLCRKFKELTGTGIVNYIHRLRVEHAKEFLLSPDGNRISLVAQKVGYNDTSYFNRIFKRYTGCTPSEFQQLH